MELLFIRLIFALAIGFLVTRYCIPLCIRLAHRCSIIDIPDGRIKCHEGAIPYLGGVAIFIGFLTSCSLVIPFHNTYFLLLVGLVLIVMLGFLDDTITLSPAQKAVGQCVVALCLLKSGFYFKIHALSDPFMLGVSFMWLLLMMNAFNLIDVMDGLASILGITSGFLFLVAALHNGHYEAALLVCALIGSLGAFLWVNYPPATMYMGDTGSLFIGTFFGVLPFLFSWGTYTIYGYFGPLFFLAIPLMELAWLVVIRTYHGIPFYCGSNHHYALMLRRAGYSKKYILFLSVVAGFIIGTPALFYIVRPQPTIAIGICALFILLFLSICVIWGYSLRK